MPSSVFISSTSRDLADYRQAAITTCLKLGLYPVAMEFFEAMGMGATEGSCRQLDKADVYVGIFAHRYGYVEQGYDRSVTEIEFDYAGEGGLERLCFLVDPQYPWPPDAIDYAQHERLKAFKDRVNTSVIRAQFTTVDDFAARLMHALVEWQRRHPEKPAAPLVQEAAATFISNAPPRPSYMIGRSDDLRSLKARFGISDTGEHRPAGMQAQTIVRGWPGVGKTSLVTTLAYDPHVEKAFPDGVLWAHLGEKPDPLSELKLWANALGLASLTQPGSLDDMMARLRTILRHKRMLLIVDDVWKADHIGPFRVAGPQCTTLMTTRLPIVAEQLASAPDDIFLLGVLSDEDSLELLSRLAGEVVQAFPEKCAALVRDLEGLPLALRVAGRLLDSEAKMGMGGVVRLIDDLRESGKLLQDRAPDDRFDPRTGTTPTISLLLKQSTDHLSPEVRDCFAFLGVFAPKPATFDLEALKSVWLVDDPMPTVRALVGLGLLEFVKEIGRFQMHALLAMHARTLLDEP